MSLSHTRGTNMGASESGTGFGMHLSYAWTLGGRVRGGVHVELEVGANVAPFDYLGHVRGGLQAEYQASRDVELIVRYYLSVYANGLRDVGSGDDVYVTKLIGRYRHAVLGVGARTDLVEFPGLATFNSALDYWTVESMYRVKTVSELGMWIKADLDHFSATTNRDYDGNTLRLSLLFTGQ